MQSSRLSKKINFFGYMPVEMIYYIFNYLDRDLLHLGTVSKLFQAIINTTPYKEKTFYFNLQSSQQQSIAFFFKNELTFNYKKCMENFFFTEKKLKNQNLPLRRSLLKDDQSEFILTIFNFDKEIVKVFNDPTILFRDKGIFFYYHINNFKQNQEFKAIFFKARFFIFPEKLLSTIFKLELLDKILILQTIDLRAVKCYQAYLDISLLQLSFLNDLSDDSVIDITKQHFKNYQERMRIILSTIQSHQDLFFTKELLKILIKHYPLVRNKSFLSEQITNILLRVDEQKIEKILKKLKIKAYYTIRIALETTLSDELKKTDSERQFTNKELNSITALSIWIEDKIKNKKSSQIFQLKSNS